MPAGGAIWGISATRRNVNVWVFGKKFGSTIENKRAPHRAAPLRLEHFQVKWPRFTVENASEELRAFSGEVDAVHRRKCVRHKDESRFHLIGNGFRSACRPR